MPKQDRIPKLVEVLRQKAQSYEKFFGEGESSVAMRQAADAIEELLSTTSAQKETIGVLRARNSAQADMLDGEWISVEERLPEENKNYLTYGVFLPLGVKAMDMFRFDGKKWLTSADVKIAHWMPLPDPPKEETP